MKKILTLLFIVLYGVINAQNFFSKEILFNQPNSSIVNGYFKNGFNVVLKSNTALEQGQVISLSSIPDSIKLLDSFEFNISMGFVFFEKNSNIFYERIVENKNNHNVYLIRKNLTLNTTDSIFIRQTNHFGVHFSKIKKFGDTTAIQVWHLDSINVSQSINVNDFYILVNKTITNTIVKPKYNLFGNAFADYYLMSNKLFITCNYDLLKLSLYVHDLNNASVDSSINYYKPFTTSDNSFIFNYTKINQKLYLLNAYKTSTSSVYDSLILIDIGSGTSLITVKTYAVNNDYSFISNSLMLDYMRTGYGNNAVINKIGTNLSLTPFIVFNKSSDNKLLTHSYFFENLDTQYVCGSRYDNFINYATIEKIYPYKTGIKNLTIKDIQVFYAYPNPTQQFFNINLPDQPSQIVATNTLGKQTNLITTEKGYNVSSLVDGLYIISFTVDNKLYAVKIWVKK